MTGPAGGYQVKLTPRAEEQWERLKRRDHRRANKVTKALGQLRSNPAHRGLHAHKWDSLKGEGPNGEDIWTAYVENRTPSAYRIFYYYDNAVQGLIYVISIEPHQ